VLRKCCGAVLASHPGPAPSAAAGSVLNQTLRDSRRLRVAAWLSSAQPCQLTAGSQSEVVQHPLGIHYLVDSTMLWYQFTGSIPASGVHSLVVSKGLWYLLTSRVYQIAVSTSWWYLLTSGIYYVVVSAH
jgi:hypothetical protein